MRFPITEYVVHEKCAEPIEHEVLVESGDYQLLGLPNFSYPLMHKPKVKKVDDDSWKEGLDK